MDKRYALSRAILYLFLSAGTAAMMLPFLWMVSTSFKTVGSLAQLPPQWIPHPFSLANYATVWNKVNFARYTLNSVILVVVELAGSLLSCAFVAFGLAMFEFKLRKWIYLAMMASLMLPFQVMMIPSYFIWKSFGVLDTYYPFIIPSFLGGSFGIFLVHQYFKSLPKELYEAAYVDGLHPFGIFWKIYVPLGKPALSALAIFSFIGAWNNTVGPLIYIQDRSLYTLPLALLYLKTDTESNMALIMAGAVIITLPVLLVYLVAQRQFVQGIASTGLKG